MSTGKPLPAFDRFLMWLAPEFAARRVRSRMIVERLARHYEAATVGRRTENWVSNGFDADFALRNASRVLRNHARDLIRNNGYAKRGQRTIVGATVGTGILPKAIGPDAVKAQKLWKDWALTTECESDNRMSFNGIQAVAMKALYSDGEVFIRRRPRKLSDGLTIPLQIQVLEADYLNTAWNMLTSDAGGPIIQGIEFDLLGRRAAYWMYKNHPGSGRNSQAPVRVPASEVIHLYEVDRPGQNLGVSWLAQAIVNMKDLDEFEDAELMRQKIAACFAAFVTDTDGSASPIGGTDVSQDPTIDELEPGMVHYLPPGKQITTASPPAVTEGDFSARVLRRVASSIGITYEDFTGDYSNSNFSSARMARLNMWANVEHWQSNILIPILCQGVWNWAMQAAQLSGELPDTRDIPTATWTTQPMPMLEPDKEGLALQRMVRGGFKTPSQAIREQGRDPDEFLAEYEADVEKIDAAGLIFDSDPRKTTQAGMEQASETAVKVPDEPETDDPAAEQTPPKRELEVLRALGAWIEQQKARSAS